MTRPTRLALSALGAFALTFACKPVEKPLTPEELQTLAIQKEAKDRAECHVIAVSQSGFDPTVAADPPPRTISETHKAGGDVVGSGAVAKGAAKGAVGGVVVGAIAGDAGKGAAIGAGAGALIGGARRHQETQKMVTTTRTNPEYAAYEQKKNGYRTAFDVCLSSRKATPPVAK
jgi:hypothetical protein